LSNVPVRKLSKLPAFSQGMIRITREGERIQFMEQGDDSSLFFVITVLPSQDAKLFYLLMNRLVIDLE